MIASSIVQVIEIGVNSSLEFVEISGEISLYNFTMKLKCCPIPRTTQVPKMQNQ